MLSDIKLPIINKKIINDYECEYTIEVNDGTGSMSCIHVYPGIEVIYNNFHCYDTPLSEPYENYIEINHCLKGKFECAYNQNYYTYLCEGDLTIHNSSFDQLHSSFPLGYYEGVEVLIDVNKAKDNIIFQQFHIDLQVLLNRLKSYNKVYSFRATQQIEHICLEMYHVDNHIKVDYLKIKVLELLVFLSNTDFEITDEKRRYYPKDQIERVKKIKNYMGTHMCMKHDLDALAKKYNINVNTLRKSFKEIYGKPIYQWFKEYRLEQSKCLLKESTMSILEIANEVGYANPSKYSAAFTSYMKQTPQQYRKSNIKMD